MRTLICLLTIILVTTAIVFPQNSTGFIYFPSMNWSKTDRFQDWYFPLKKGTTLIYRGTVKWTVPDTSPPIIKEKVMTWKMKVIDTFRRDQLFAALIKGMPQDLCWYDETKKPGLYLILRMGTGHYYLEENPARAKQIFYGEIKNPRAKSTANLERLIQDRHLFIDAPLVVNKMWGADDAFQYVRPDRSYCWIVDSVAATKHGRTYRIFYFTRPDHLIVDFAPGVGIVYFEYNHHGTVSECYMNLVESGIKK